MKKKIVRHQNSSPTALLSSINQFAKSATRAIHELVLLREKNAALRKANNKLNRRCRTKKRRIQEKGSLSLRNAQNFQAQNNVNTQLQTDLAESSSRTKVSVLQQRRCKSYEEFSHNVRTCQNIRIKLGDFEFE